MKYNFKQETDFAKMPTRHTAVSAGVDFYADGTTTIPPNGSRIVSTGISWNPDGSEFPKSPHGKLGYIPDFSIALIIQSRSGYAFKSGIEASNAGVIDQDYVSTEENKAIIKVKLYNHSKAWFTIKHGDKICQGVPQLIPYFDDVETLDDTRNGKGFGSSDEKEKKIEADCYTCVSWDECRKDPKLPRRVTCYAHDMNQYMKDPDYVPPKKKQYCPLCCTEVASYGFDYKCPGCNSILKEEDLVTIKEFMDKK